jgi:nucleoside-diphosphate-sugar epimerase
MGDLSVRKKTILVTGASGFVGAALCKELTARGVRVKGSTRSLSSCPHHTEVVVVGDVNGNTDWHEALIDCNVVFHLAARVHVMQDTITNPIAEFRKVNTIGTEHLARSAVKAGVKRLIYVSSIKVNGEEVVGEFSYSERDAPMPQDPYGVSKLEAEQALHRIAKETGLEVVIVRPPLIYGAGVRGNFLQMMKVIMHSFPLPLASVSNQRDLIYVGNLVDALIACAMHPMAAGQTYLVRDGESVSTPYLIRNLAKVLGSSSLLFPFSICILKFFAKQLGKSAVFDRLTQSLRIDDSKIRKELGWKPPYTMEQGLKATADWYLAQQKK